MVTLTFNEPEQKLKSNHLVDLTPSIEAKCSFLWYRPSSDPGNFHGIANIMAAKSIVLFAYGEGKAQAVTGTVTGPVTEELPTSVLQRHEDVTGVLNAEALSLLDS